MNKTVKVKKLVNFTGHSSAVYALSKHFTANHFLSSGGDQVIAEWNIDSSSDGNLLAKVPGTVYNITILPSRGIVLAGQSQGLIHVINIHTKEEIRTLHFHDSPVFYIIHSAKHKLLFSLSGNGLLCVSDSDDFTLLKKLQLGEGKLRSAAINPDETIFVAGAADGSIYIFSLPELITIHHLQVHKEGFSTNALSFTPNGKYLLSGSRDAYLNIYDVHDNYTLFNSIAAHNYAIYAIVFNPSGTFFATASRDKTIKIWDTNTFEVLIRIDRDRYDGHLHSVNNLLWLDDKTLVSCSDDKTVMVWAVEIS